MISAKLFYYALLPFIFAGCSPSKLINSVVPDEGYAKHTRSYAEHDRSGIDIFVPDHLQQPAPVILFLYGGSWKMGDKEMYGFLGQALTSRGYVVAIADYRVHPDVNYPSFIKDSAQALAWAKKNIREFNGDPEQLFLMGHSAGAYNAMMLVVEPKYLQSVNMQPSDIKAFVGISGPYDFLPLTSGTLKKIFKPAADIKDTQPITYASHAKTPPMLLLSDKHDWVVYPKNTRNMAKALQEAGNEVEVKYYNGAGHIGIVASFATVLYFENVPILDDVDTFLKKFANGE